MFSIIKKELRHLFQNKSIMFTFMLSPLLVIIAFHLMFNTLDKNVEIENIKVAIEEDENLDMNSFKKILRAHPHVELMEYESLDKVNLHSNDTNKKIDAIIYIEIEKEEKKIQIEINQKMNEIKKLTMRTIFENIYQTMEQQIIYNELGQYIEDRNEIERILEEKYKLVFIEQKTILDEVEQVNQHPSEIKKEQNEEQGVDIMPRMIFGYSIIYGAIIIIYMARSFIKDRESGMVARVSSSPIRMRDYIIGKWVPYNLLVFIQIAIFILAGIFVADMQVNHIGFIVFYTLLLIILSTSIALFISMSVSTDAGANGWMQLVSILSLFGGIIAPIGFLPDSLITFSHVFPYTWIAEGYLRAAYETIHIEELLKGIIVPILYTILFVILSFMQYPKFIAKSKK